ncbi:hypothetical protein PALB_1120 [Pseudoalteromonas luteoviolacea B = ATCC 29581]|nr:hypothetical protein PALB_1120 [Pseudoalteromonas luteoviolacea B = ATCC 29581]
MTNIETRVNELEERIAFQDETIEVLNDELKIHQQRLAKMQRQLELLAEKIKDSQQSPMMHPSQEPPPPHY